MMNPQSKPKVNEWVKWLVGILWTIIFATLTTTIGHVIANDKQNTEDHKKIRQESADARERIMEKMEKNTDKLEKKIDELRTQQFSIYKEIMGKLNEISQKVKSND